MTEKLNNGKKKNSLNIKATYRFCSKLLPPPVQRTKDFPERVEKQEMHLHCIAYCKCCFSPLSLLLATELMLFLYFHSLQANNKALEQH